MRLTYNDNLFVLLILFYNKNTQKIFLQTLYITKEKYMLVNNYSANKNLYFSGITVKEGGVELLKKEGAYAISKIEKAKDEFKKYNWHLNIDSENYSLTSPTTKKTYFGPFSVKRHVKKNKEKADEYRIIVRMGNNNLEKYAINYDSMKEVQNVYKEVKNSYGIDKMINLLKILEKGFNLKQLRHKMSKLQTSQTE
jgi:hypothetical protein